MSHKKLMKNDEKTVPKSLKIVVLEVLKSLKIMVWEVLGCPGGSWGSPGTSLGSKTEKHEKTVVRWTPFSPWGPKEETKLEKNRHDGVHEGILSDKSHHLDCFLSVRV